MAAYRLDLGGDRRWIMVTAAITAVELCWWAIAWLSGIAPAPLVPAYLGFTLFAVAAAAVIRLALGLRPSAVPSPVVLVAALLVALGASAFLPLKYAIPSEIPFWLDQPTALAERSLFGADPWIYLDTWLGWAARPMDWVYGSWLPVQSLALLLLVLSRPSPAKTRALIAYSLAWFLLGVVAATLFSSAGPIFYDRAFGGDMFAALGETLRQRGTWIVIAESDRMWAASLTDSPGLVAGISAIPSIHVAISLWIYLAARQLVPRAAPLALAYWLLIWVGSVQLGWHYAVDGLTGSVGMIAVWWLARFALPRQAAATA